MEWQCLQQIIVNNRLVLMELSQQVSRVRFLDKCNDVIYVSTHLIGV